MSEFKRDMDEIWMEIEKATDDIDVPDSLLSENIVEELKKNTKKEERRRMRRITQMAATVAVGVAVDVGLEVGVAPKTSSFALFKIFRRNMNSTISIIF